MGKPGRPVLIQWPQLAGPTLLAPSQIHHQRLSPAAQMLPRQSCCREDHTPMLSTSNLSIQFGAKPLFEQVTVKFSDGNRYGLIGANGSGKSTLMKVLGGDLEQSTGEVMLQVGLRLGKLNQNQFGYEDERVLDVVMQGHMEMWRAMQERDRIYANPEATDDDYMKAAELEGKFAEYGGYDAEARAAAILIGAGLSESLHHGPM